MIALLLLWLAAPAPDWDAVFHRQEGWTGADATWSVTLGGGRTLWLFGDTFYGKVEPDGSRGDGWRFEHNSAALQDASGVHFTDGEIFRAEEGWFWPYDGTCVAPGEADVLLGQFTATGEAGAFGFRAAGLWLARTNGVQVRSCRQLPFFQRHPDGSSTSFGAGLMDEGPWTYVYGVRDAGGDKRLKVARVPRGRLSQPATWRFWDGAGWSRRMEDAAATASDVSNELSVHRDGDRYLLVSGRAGVSCDVLLRTASAPTGPWSEPQVVFTHPGPGFAYNAKAHPELSDERGLLVSYNVNSLDPQDVVRDASLYRPRFLRLQEGSPPPPAKPGPLQPTGGSSR